MRSVHRRQLSRMCAVGRLARSWERSPDRRRVTYRLRTGVRWHDGRPVTAHDVAFTMRLLPHPQVRLVWIPEATFAHRRVHGLSTPFRAGANTNMEKLWVEKGK